MIGNTSTTTTRFTGDYAPLPDVYQAAFRYGIRFIELRFPRSAQYCQRIFGPLDIRVTEELEEASLRVRYQVKVLNGPEACVSYENINNGLCVAWLFDDKYWMNRVFLLDNLWMYHGIWAMHTREGMVPGSLIKAEVDCLREVITVEKPMWKVMRQTGKEYTYCWTKEAAQRELTEQRIEIGWYLEPGVKLEKKPEIIEIIRRSRHLLNGWTSSEEFQEKYMPKIKLLITERKKDLIPEGNVQFAPQDIQNMIKQTLASMSPADLERIATEARERQVNSNAELDDAVNTEQKADSTYVFTRSGLQSKRTEELRSIASRLGISKPERIKKEQLVEAILGAQMSPANEEESLNAPVLIDTPETSEEPIAE